MKVFSRKNSLVFYILVVVVGLVSWGCGGGGGGGGGGNDDTVVDDGGSSVTFPGGTLEELKQFSSTLSFNHLEISGKLELPHYSNETITVDSLTITSTGSIGYTYSTCEYVDAPSINIVASGAVSIEGSINLNGRSGTRVSSGASCNSCYGQDGGDVSISAASIVVAGSINNSGGSGGSTVYIGFPSSGCSGGASGNTNFDATDIDLSQGSVTTRAGQGGYGGGGSGSNGAPGTVDFIADDWFKMISGEVSSNGELTLQAARTEIYGPITYATMIESIGGSTDNTPPTVSIQNPTDNTDFNWADSTDVVIEAGDSGTGVKNVEIVGLGYDDLHSGTEFQDGLLTVTIPSVDVPASLSVAVTDNKGNVTNASLSGLSISYKQESEPNDSPSGPQDVDCPDIIEGDIQEADSGFVKLLSYPGSGSSDLNQTVQDWYRFTLASYAKVIIDLDFSGSATATDIDLFLFDSSGSTQLNQSFEDNAAENDYTEKITAYLDAGTYTIGIQAYNVDAREDYTLTVSKE
jgi:hypothetical protein